MCGSGYRAGLSIERSGFKSSLRLKCSLRYLSLFALLCNSTIMSWLGHGLLCNKQFLDTHIHSFIQLFIHCQLEDETAMKRTDLQGRPHGQNTGEAKTRK